MLDVEESIKFWSELYDNQLVMIEILNGQWQLRKSWSVSHNKAILT